MPDTDPEGPLIVAVMAIRKLLLDSHYWATLVEAGTDQGEVYIDSLPLPPGNAYTKAELEALRPFAIISQAPGDGYSVDLVSAGTTYPSGHVAMRIEVPIPEDIQDDEHEIGQFALRTFGKLIRTRDVNRPGMLDLSGTPGRPFVNRLSVSDYYRPDEHFVQQHGDFVACDVDLYWGFKG